MRTRSITVILVALLIVSAQGLSAQHAFVDAQHIRQVLEQFRTLDAQVNSLPPPRPDAAAEAKRELDNLKKQRMAAAHEIATVIQAYYRFPFPSDRELFNAVAQNPEYANPFFGELIGDSGLADSYAGEEEGAAPVEPAAAVLAKVGGIDVTAIADGLSRFLVQRAQEELIASFLSDFKRALSEYPELATLFPQTTEFLAGFAGSERPATILPLLGGLLRADLLNLSRSVPKLATMPAAKGSPAERRRLAYEAFLSEPAGDVLLVTMQLSASLVDGEGPAAALEELNALALRPAHAGAAHPVMQAARLLYLISASLQAQGGERIWISAEEVSTLASDDELRVLYFGLFYQQLKLAGIEFGGTRAEDLLLQYAGAVTPGTAAPSARTIRLFRSWTALVQAVQSVDQARLQWMAGGSDTSALTAYLDGIVSLFDATAHLAWIAPNRAEELRALTVRLSTAATVAKAVQIKDYQTVFIRIAPFVQTVLNRAVKDDPQANAIAASFVRYGGFAVSVAQAKSAEEVQGVLATFAAPSGSYRVKYDSKWSVALNAYLGLMGGYEIHGAPAGNLVVAGAHAPLGFSVSYSLGGSKGWSLSLFAGIVDVGAITAYRLSEGNAAVLPDVALANILAPSVDLVVGLGKLPVAFGAGVELGPALRGVATGGSQISAAPPLRLQLFLAADLPIFNLYTAAR